jgi:hypothetical protein
MGYAMSEFTFEVQKASLPVVKRGRPASKAALAVLSALNQEPGSRVRIVFPTERARSNAQRTILAVGSSENFPVATRVENLGDDQWVLYVGARGH